MARCWPSSGCSRSFETQYRILQRRGDKVPPDPSEIRIETSDEAPLLEGIYRSRLNQQPPAEWKELDEEQRAERMRQAVIDSGLTMPPCYAV